MQMQSELNKDVPQTLDPFMIIKNHRKKFIRPKCKYIRKVPIPPRIKKTKPLPRLAQLMEYKNERKMTADSEIQMLLNEQPGDTLTEVKMDAPKIEIEQDRFFQELIQLDYVLPLEEEGNEGRKFIMSGQSNCQYIDFFGQE